MTLPQPFENVDAMPRFCVECGRPMMFEDRTRGFDPTTGAPLLTAYAYCKGSWIERLINGEPHYEAVVAPRPKERD